MGQKTWAEAGVDLEWMLARVPDYNDMMVRSKAKSGKRNKTKTLHLEGLLADYEDTFPGRMASWKFKKLGPDGGTESERRKVIMQRFADYFKHHLKHQGKLGLGQTVAKGLLKLSSTKNSRKESDIMAYLRLEGERLAPEIEADYKAHVEECKALGVEVKTPPVARRAQFLSKRFKEETPELQAHILANRLQCYAKSPAAVLKALLDTGEPLDEEERKTHALLMQGNVGKLIRSLQVVVDNIKAETGWNVAVLVGGPRPVTGGNIHIEHFHSGELEGSTFNEKYPDEWGAVTGAFARFCQDVFPPEMRVRFSTADITQPSTSRENQSEQRDETSLPTPTPTPRPSPAPTPLDIPLAAEGSGNGQEETDWPSNIDPSLRGEGGLSAQSLGVNTQSPTGTADRIDPNGISRAESTSGVPEGQHPAQSIDNSIQAGSQENVMGVSDNPAPVNPAPLGVHVEQQKSEERNQADTAKPAPVATSSTSSPTPPLADGNGATEGDSSPPNGHVTAPSAPSAASAATTVTPVSSIEPASRDQPAPLDQTVNPLTQALIDRPSSGASPSPPTRSTRSRDKHSQPTGLQDTENEKAWSYLPSLYISERLAKFEGAEIARLYKELEAALKHPNGSQPTRLNTSAAPAPLKKWKANRDRDLWEPPKELIKPDHLENTIAWYRKLQPPQRNASWPPVRGQSPRSWDWSALMKGGSHGIYLLLVSIAWIPECGAQDPENLKHLIDDAKWVLGVLVDLAINPPPIAPKTASNKRKEKDASANAGGKKPKRK